MINYSRSKIYCIRSRDTNEIIWIGGTVSNLKRRYWNHKCNSKDSLYQAVRERGLDWHDLKIELVTDFESCKDRVTLNFAAEVAYIYTMQNNEPVLHHFLNNIDYFIE